MATKAELETRLAQAEQAKHDLITGTRTVKVGYEGYSAEFANDAAGVAALDRYIADLKQQLGQSGGRYRAIGVTF